MTRRLYSLLFVSLLSATTVHAAETDANTLFQKMRERLNYVKDYVADVKMKIDVSFMRVPNISGKLYYKAPDKLKLERHGGIAILPKKSVNLTLSNLIPSGDATVIDAGHEMIGGINTHIIKVVPVSEQSDIILTKIWIDETRMLALRTETTTRDNGTVRMDLQFDKYANIALPDKVIFYTDVKEYKLPKGITMDYESAEQVPQQAPADAKSAKPRKGRIQIEYLNYVVNKGVPDEIFVEKKK